MVEQLELIVFKWSVRKLPDKAWGNKFKILQNFKEKHDHCDVPHVIKGDTEMNSLGHWVAKQRDAQRGRKILAERSLKLESIRLKWSVRKSAN